MRNKYIEELEGKKQPITETSRLVKKLNRNREKGKEGKG